MNTEIAAISAICKNNDIGAAFDGDIDEYFVSHKDVWSSVLDYYQKYKSLPGLDWIETAHRDVDVVHGITGPAAPYVDRLRDEFLKNRIRALFLSENQKLNDAAGADVLQSIYAEVTKLSRMSGKVMDVSIKDVELAEKHYETQAKRTKEMGGSPGIPTGFRGIDLAYPTGMAPGHLIVVIGWPGKKKTWFTGYLACKAFDSGFKTMIVSLEMQPETMRDRLYTMLGSGVFRNSDLSRGDIGIDKFKGWAETRFDGKGDIVICSSEGHTDISPGMVQGWIDKHKPNLVICDYHQLFIDNKGSRSEIERNRNVSREFKQLATSNRIPIVDITAATMDDISDTNNPPLLSQVAWSKAIEYDADMAVAVHGYPDSNLVEVVSRKNRHGPEFSMYLDWDINNGIIKEIYET